MLSPILLLHLLSPGTAGSGGAFTLEAALDRARATAPAIVASRLRIEEARGRLRGARLLLSENPTVDASAGNRSDGTTSRDLEVEVAQPLDPPGRRSGRIAAAKAAVAQEEARSRETVREVLRGVATTFVRALDARARLELAEASRRLAEEGERVAERRFQAGEVAQLDVNLTRLGAAQAQAERRTALARLEGELSQLRVLLGLEPKERVELADGSPELPDLRADALLSAVRERPDIQLMEAEIAEAEADARIARSSRWPSLALRGSYREEAGDRVVLGGVSIGLPVFDRGQELQAVATARIARLRQQRDALVRAAESEVQGALASYEHLRAAAGQYAHDVLPLLAQNEAIALESYDAGQVGLVELLVVRRESLAARRASLDQLTEARITAIELQSRAGALR